MYYCLSVEVVKHSEEFEEFFQCYCEAETFFLVAMRFGETPVPIPNTTVKTKTAESTILVTVWEDRWLPDYKKEHLGL